MLTPEDIQGREFLVSLRGYDRAEVRAFLTEIADHIRQLEARVQAPEAHAVEDHRTDEHAGDDAGAERERPAPGYVADIGSETQRILDAAQEAADSIARQARVDADREVQSARRQAARLIAEGEQQREEAETIVAGLEAARAAMSHQLREIGTTVERVISELGAPPLPAPTVREALTAERGSATTGREKRVPPDAPVEVAPVQSEGRAGPSESVEPPAEESQEPEEAGEAPQEPEEAAPGEESQSPVGAAAGEEPKEPAGAVAGEEPQEPAEAAAGEEPQEPVRAAAGEQPPPAAPEEPGEGDAVTAERAGDLVDAEATGDPSDPLGLRKSALTPLQPQLVRAIKRGLQDMQNLVLDRLRRMGREGELESLLPKDAEIQEIGTVVSDALQQAYADGVAVASLMVDQVPPAPIAERALVEEFLADAAERIRRPLAATLRMARSADEGPSSWNDRVGAVFAELRGTAAEELAAMHLLHSYELGLVDAWTAGGVTHRRWVLGREPRCPEARCRHNSQAGVLPMGAAYPSGHEVPPVHVGCTCTTIPISEPPP